MRRAFDLLNLIADGGEHAGAELAVRMGVTRAAVWNQAQRLREEGLEILATTGHGYLLPGGYEPLDAAAIRATLADLGCRRLAGVETLTLTDSTNEQLLKAQAQGDIHARALFAEYQSAGRGRRGDRWMSPPGSGLCFSLGWRFDSPPPTFSALSLVVGVALAGTLRDQGILDVGLKWPNDLVRDTRKMAGILIEMRAEAGGPSVTVIGIGLNVRLAAPGRALIDRPSDDVVSASGRQVSRNALAAALLDRLTATLEVFAQEGFPPFRDAWSALDVLADREVILDLGQRQVRGIARGVDAHGALIIEHDGERERFVSGHLTAY